MTEQISITAPDRVSSVDEEVRAAFTERIRADVARLLADSLAARAALTGSEPDARGTSRRLLSEAAEHDREAQRHEARVVMLRQLEHDGRI